MFIGFLLIFSFGCNDAANKSSLLNTAHLDYLYEEISMSDTPAAFIYIYCEAPDYQRIGAKGEGIACVDDAARAAVFYLRHYQATGSEPSLQKARRLLNFTMLMQAENGFFYNFINKDYQIDTVIVNSRPTPDWWSWRALWALTEAHRFYAATDQKYSAKLKMHIGKILAAIKTVDNRYPQTVFYQGFELPAWLPHETAADQAAVLILGLLPYFQTDQKYATARLIEILGRGVTLMQAGDSLSFPYGAFLSWRNEWHAWGNSQSEALFKAGHVLNKPKFIRAALAETANFYPYLMKENYLNAFRVQRNEGKMTAINQKKYEQIAYGIRPMVMGSLQAYQATEQPKFAKQAGDIACWLLGKNITGQPLYDPGTGRCYDGINNATQINQNAGAESTIEALLTLLAVEQNPIARQVVQKYYQTVNTREFIK